MKKIISRQDLETVVNQLRAENKAIVLVGGCFDLLHKGHATFLDRAKRAGDTLIVALESDENVKRLKGEGRPINAQLRRAHALATLAIVDYILLLPPLTIDDEYIDLITSVKPAIIAITEGDPKKDKKELQAHIIGGKVLVVTKYLKEYSTSQMLKKQ